MRRYRPWPWARAARCTVWRGRRGADPLAALRPVLLELPRPAGCGLAWVAAERQVARGVRALLTETLGLPRGQVRAAAYWQHGAAGHHENLDD